MQWIPRGPQTVRVRNGAGDEALLLTGKLVHGAEVPWVLPTSPWKPYGPRGGALRFAAPRGGADREKIRPETPLDAARYAWRRERAETVGR